jgi:hypothetical protein
MEDPGIVADGPKSRGMALTIWILLVLDMSGRARRLYLLRLPLRSVILCTFFLGSVIYQAKHLN